MTDRCTLLSTRTARHLNRVGMLALLVIVGSNPDSIWAQGAQLLPPPPPISMTPLEAAEADLDAPPHEFDSGSSWIGPQPTATRASFFGEPEPTIDFAVDDRPRASGSGQRPAYAYTPPSWEDESLFDLDEPTYQPPPTLWQRSLSDYQQFYSQGNLIVVGGLLATGAVMANSNIDSSFRDLFQENVVNTATDEWSETLHLNKEFGNGQYTLPLMLSAYATTWLPGDRPLFVGLHTWGDRGLRTFLVGAPLLVVGQVALGASRPGETSHGSSWRFGQDDNGISGHAFMGALPFLAASELSDNRLVQGSLLVASTLPGLSRINDDAHYASQVLLGWSLAYLSYRAVIRTDQGAKPWKLVAWQNSQAQGLGLEWRW